LGRLLSSPIPDAEVPMVMTIGAVDSAPLTPQQAAALGIAGEACERRAVPGGSSAPAELERLRRLRAAEALLPALFRGARHPRGVSRACRS
jgi:hypothetical protein